MRFLIVALLLSGCSSQPVTQAVDDNEFQRQAASIEKTDCDKETCIDEYQQKHVEIDFDK